MHMVQLSILGCTLHIESGQSELVKRVAARFRESVVQSDLRPDYHVSYHSHNGQSQVTVNQQTASLELRERWPSIETLIQLLVIDHRNDLRFVHASCVDTPFGAALFIGASTSGKTTLAAALCRTGFSLLSDDITPLDLATGLAYPFPKAPEFRPDTLDTIDERIPYSPVTSSAVMARNAIPVRFMFFLDESEPHASTREESSQAFQEWEVMYSLCCPLTPLRRPSNSSFLHKRDKSAFDREPEIAPMRPVDALKRFMKHIHPPCPSLSRSLPQVSGFLRKTVVGSLKPGHLDKTISLVTGVFDSEGPQLTGLRDQAGMGNT